MNARKQPPRRRASPKIRLVVIFGACATLACVVAIAAIGDFTPKELPVKDKRVHYDSPQGRAEAEAWETAPTISVFRGGILVDGAAAGGLPDAGPAKRIEPLFDALMKRRELVAQILPGRPFPGTVLLQFYPDATAFQRESVTLTAKAAGYTRQKSLPTD